jgi:hypothetical protein
MTSLIPFLLAVLVLAKVNAENPAWEAYKLQYGYAFDSAEEDQKREAIWADSLNKLVRNQKKYTAGGELPSFRLGINKFSMYTYEEKVEKFTGLTREARKHRRRMFGVKQAKTTPRKLTTTKKTTTAAKKPTTAAKKPTITRKLSTSRKLTTSKRPTTTTKPTTTVKISTNTSVDWRNTPLVGPVKNQGTCG